MLADIPVEFVKIAKSDVDNGKKIPQGQSAAPQAVRVDQGSNIPFLGSNQVQNQSELPSQAVTPHDGYYMPEYYGNMNNPHSGHAPLHNNESVKTPSDNSGSLVSAPTSVANKDELVNEDKKPYFKEVHELDKNSSYDLDGNKNNFVNNSLPQEKQASLSKSLNQQENNGALHSLLNGLMGSLGTALGTKGLEWLYNYFSNKAVSDKKVDSVVENKIEDEKKLDDVDLSDCNVDVLSNDSFSDIRKDFADIYQQAAPSTNVYQGSGENSMKSKAGITDTSVTPTELVSKEAPIFDSSKPSKPLIKNTRKIDSSIEEMKNESFDVKNIDSSKTATSLKAKSSLKNNVDIKPLPEVANLDVSNNVQVEKLESRKGITETILPEEIIELPAQQEVKDSVEPEVIEISSELVPVNNQPQTYLQRIQSFLTSQSTIDSLDKALTTGQGRGLLALGLALPALAISAITPVAATVTPVVAPAVTMTNTLAPAVATTTATTGMLSSMSGAQAFMAVKTFIGLVGFAVTKNPTFLLPK